MPIFRGHLNWIMSEGGPLLLTPEDCLDQWEGAHPPSNGRIIHADFRWTGPGSSETDYDRACDIHDYLGLLQVGNGWGLVLNDTPDQTAWWPYTASTGGILVRWSYAEEEQSILAALAHVPEAIWEPTALEISVGEFPLHLFDAALAGPDAITREDYLLVHLAPGRYSIATGLYKPDPSTFLVLHRLLLKG